MFVMFRFVLCLWMAVGSTVIAQDHQHQHGDSDKPVKRPRVFLDKSPRIVAYQLKRLDNTRLLLVETRHDDPKYLPVFETILLRPGIARKNRDDAIAGLVAIKQTNPASEMLQAMASLDGDDREQVAVGSEISAMLLSLPPETLNQHAADFREAVASDNPVLSAAGFAGLILIEHSEEAWKMAQRSETSRLAWLQSVSLVPPGAQRESLRSNVLTLLEESQPQSVRVEAIQTLPMMKADPTGTFNTLASFVNQDEFRTAAVRSLRRVPDESRNPLTAAAVVRALVAHAEQTPAAKRTTDEFLDAVELCDELLVRLPAAEARSYRQRLRQTTVRVVRLSTVKEEMRYDRPFFVVEAGRPVQVVLENRDLMPHNLVITSPGQLKEVAFAAAELGVTPGKEGKLYVPESPDVQFASGMVNAGQRELLTFTAPSMPGEYPYVCTFPRHWMRMYGVMLVVPSLDEWQRNPVTPKDPLGNNRSFVEIWQLSHFEGEQLHRGLKGRTASIGARLFKEATCLSCHKMKGEGGAVGPELTEVLQRFKGDHRLVLREILEPGYRIDPKYAVKTVLDLDGNVTSGIVVAEDKSSVSLLVNPEAPSPTVIAKDNIDEIIPSTASMMPKSLLDKFTRDEVLEILAYITGGK